MNKERLGEINISNEGYEMKIIEYNGSIDIWVEFQDEYKARVHTRYGVFKKGSIKNPYHKTIYNIGYIGQGKYNKTNYNKAYEVWRSMLGRCYNPYYLNKYPTYIDCYVCEEWHCFQNFAEWFYQNYYEIENERMCLDKDILYKGNKIYSPNTCIFVPNNINVLFCKRDKFRGKYPIGVSWNKEKRKYRAQYNEYGKTKNIGLYNTVEEAFYAYKEFKENYIKEVANEYKYLIPNKLYEAMHKYEVEMND